MEVVWAIGEQLHTPKLSTAFRTFNCHLSVGIRQGPFCEYRFMHWLYYEDRVV